MEVVYRRCCGLDVHKDSITACVLVLDNKGQREVRTKEFQTYWKDLQRLKLWLYASKVECVAMESTGVYWKPIYNLLEGRFELLLVNAKHVKHVPGRKTDVKDCQWLAQLLQCGLLRGSLVPDRPRREMRDLTRHRAQLVAQRGAVANRIHKTLEDANIKLGLVASDILGASGRDMLRALIGGKHSPNDMADLARLKMRAKIPELRLALQGHVTEHHRFVLAELMDQMEDLERRIERFGRRVEEISGPFAAAIQAVADIPGFDQRSAQNVLAEIGTDMSCFPTDDHLASWAGICPGSHESGGKRKSGKTTKGSRWLRAALVQSAWAATHTKSSYFRAQYRRLVGRRGKKRALVAVAHSLLVVIYHMLLTGRPFQDLGIDYFDKLDGARIVKGHVKRLESLGYKVTLTAREQAA
jgi:transposase